ncbi:hypothetical protein AAVH_35993, partial [Aphelenchoides avenae]
RRICYLALCLSTAALFTAVRGMGKEAAMRSTRRAPASKVIVRESTAVGNTTHLVILSSTYYPTSAGEYPANTMVVLFNSVNLKRGERFPVRLACRSTNASISTLSGAKLVQIKPNIRVCRWTQYIAICPVLKAPSALYLGRRSRSGATTANIE